jgi:AraC family transcriptional activator of pobA
MQNRTLELPEPIWMPNNLKKDSGQFNVFELNDNEGGKFNCQSYNRKGYYKIALLTGHTRLFYVDKTLEFQENGLLFTNPNVPYSWEIIDQQQTGYFCVFTEAFFDQFNIIKESPMFKPGHTPLFELSKTQAQEITQVFQSMIAEISSDFAYKYDVLRTRILDLIYKALKMQPAANTQYHDSNGALRVTSLFTELLERQFPLDSSGQRMGLRHPADFALKLSVHVNHLNRSLKKVTGNTTSQLIAERIIQEARVLLKRTDWNISEIAWCLGFEELPHFINVFKRIERQTPKSFRKMASV